MLVADIQRFCMHDGPGVRTTVFIKGCPLKCAWCHNPETQSEEKELLFYENKCISCSACQVCEKNVHYFDELHLLNRKECVFCGKCVSKCPAKALEIVGKELSVEEVFQSVYRDVLFFDSLGGITVSGGEALSQWEEVLPLVKMCKEKGISTAIETCGYAETDVIKSLVPYVDIFLYDIKDTDDVRHKKYTGVSNEKIIKNLFFIDSLCVKTIVRCILVNGVNLNEKHLENVAEIVKRLKHCEGVELLPYHEFGEVKRRASGRKSLAKKEWLCNEEQIKAAVDFLENKGIRIIKNA